MNIKHQKNYLSRRNLLQLGTGAIGTGVALSVASNLVTPEVATAQNITNPDEAIKALLDGNDRFANRKRRYKNQGYTRLQEVAKGQKPFASILGCADSRVPAEIVFDQGLGDLFVCRVAGNIAVPEEIGSLEYGSLVLGSKVILVLGHERCGAVDATLKGEEVPGQIGKLIEAIKPGVEKSKGQPGDKLENACKANILVQIENLKSSPVLSELINAKKLKIVGGYYDLDTGKVSLVS
ncbi:carbonic anhydrase [Anabaena cylindrica FACHB-243]|uniref:carbonic anhydrase n=1 Tax=Anabaena cylindrica (strain ATCC 27899 / PCC 7122) TaxID=272123 RepID=K9ZNH6_ANACC|nr:MULTISPECIES: carbonic anhydrase [Anabaena]AFZ59880.1 carbonic anhydrase [Anabaena cylindrica PCC 7122]MBD2416709.1 carbonic anhydrase [Anabaena cylindrica FACHB-243]MBY5285009.1 carbonic anhydrase [Anabaena sp. CCAP 1446/1C]MBY5310354.1 carbonic anhydrase [Anabaena sp. CCAP 1446/1C]MCM2409870.1 carbonic anhydrase [Anabaena sp. CCAP 1446/1C]